MKSEPTPFRIADVEWPTMALVVLVYFFWFLLISQLSEHPVKIAPLLIVLLTLHASLVHEITHGHPTRWIWFNTILAWSPIGLIFPYHLFRRLHLQHHKDKLLTIPDTDPESFFHCPLKWQRKCRFVKAVYWCNMTLFGRLVIGPLLSIFQVLMHFASELAGAYSMRVAFVWCLHFSACAGVILIVWQMSDGRVSLYLACAYIAHGLLGLRSFFEHRTAEDPLHRIVVVESCWFFKLLFLSNNFHATHHQHPGIPWYKVEKRYRQEKEQVLEANGNFFYSGYSDWLQYLFKPISSPVYPLNLTKKSNP